MWYGGFLLKQNVHMRGKGKVYAVLWRGEERSQVLEVKAVSAGPEPTQ